MRADFLSDDPKVPLHLLVFGVETMITTATCVADYLSWPSFTNEQKLELCKLYVPYLGLCQSVICRGISCADLKQLCS